MKEGKSFQITQNEVLSAYKAVKANKGARGVDRVDFVMFEKNWKNQLYTLWNRMSSGTYFLKPVRGVEIPKKVFSGIVYFFSLFGAKSPWLFLAFLWLSHFLLLFPFISFNLPLLEIVVFYHIPAAVKLYEKQQNNRNIHVPP